MRNISNKDKQEIINNITLILEDLYEVKFCGTIDVSVKEDGFSYTLYLNKDPFYYTSSYIQCNSVTEFLEKVKKDLRNRKLNLVRYFTGYKIDLDDYTEKRKQRISNPEI